MLWQRVTETVGLAEGGSLRAALDALMRRVGLGTTKAANEVAFTAAVIALSAKMAKADGVASDLEYRAFERVFKPPPDEAHNVRRLFDLAKRDVAGFESYARQIDRLLADDPSLKRDVFEGLFYIAAADGVLHDNEERYLRSVAAIFNLDDAVYRAIRAAFVVDPNDPYAILGVDRSVSDAGVKAHYRALVRANHPDALEARGAPDDMVVIATRKLAAINAAYEVIARERGL